MDIPDPDNRVFKKENIPELILYAILYGLLLFFAVTFGYFLRTGENLF